MLLITKRTTASIVKYVQRTIEAGIQHGSLVAAQGMI